MGGGKKKGPKAAPRAVQEQSDPAAEEIDLLEIAEQAIERQLQERAAEESGSGDAQVGAETKGQMLQRHKREARDLKAATQKKLHAVKKADKAAKQEVDLEINKLESEMAERHTLELASIESHLQSMSLQSGNQDGNGLGKEYEQADQHQAANSAQYGETSVPPISEQQKKPKGPGRQQQRKNRKTEEEKKRRQELEAKFAGGIDHRAIEKENLEKILAPLGLKIHEIPPDGNCLYRAVAHQMDCIGLSTASRKDDFANIRLVAANHLRTHVDDFLPFLTTEDGDLHTTESYEKYCHQVANSNDWGGEVELRALSVALRVPITVFMANSPKLEMGQEFLQATGSPVLLSYHLHEYGLGAHYNSVIPRA